VKKLKIALCLPWYDGADKDCVANFLGFQHYLGRLQERSAMIAKGLMPPDTPLTPLDSWDQSGMAEIPPELHGIALEFDLVAAIGVSLPGLARELCIDRALDMGADYLMFYDDDMQFDCSVLMRLLRHQLPVVAALAFTAREPIVPVLYRMTPKDNGAYHNEPILDYERDALIKVDAVGFGVVLIQATTFRRVPKPWFSNPGAGEDIQFCFQCRKYGVPIYADTSAKTVHKPRFTPEWHSEEKYLKDRTIAVPAIEVKQ